MIQHFSHTGGRETNEDKEIIYCDKNLILIGICDGHGGNKTASYISKTMPLIFKSNEIKIPLDKNQIKKVFLNIQKQFKTDKKFKYTYESGCTCSMVLIKDEFFYTINVGDSRSVACFYNEKTNKVIIKQLTIDHKPYNYDEKQRILKAGGTVINDEGIERINGLSLSRAFGDCDSEQTPPIPDIKQYKITDNLKFIIVACDGIFDVLTNEQVCNFILQQNYDKNMKLKENKKKTAEEVCKLAIQNLTTDNVSCIIVFFK